MKTSDTTNSHCIVPADALSPVRFASAARINASILIALSRLLSRPSETLDGYEQPELVEVIFRKKAWTKVCAGCRQAVDAFAERIPDFRAGHPTA